MNADRSVAEILERVAEGILLLDNDLRPTLANLAARRMLGFERADLPPRLPSEEVLAVARRAVAESKTVEEVITTWFPLRQSLKVRVGRLDSKDGMIVILDDVTQEAMAQRVRTEFVAHASHELKSPVAGLQALAEAMSQALPDDPAAAARFSERIAAESDRLGRLISDLLDLSKLEDTAATPDDPVDLSAIASQQFDEIRALAESKSIESTKDIQDGVWVQGDDQQLGLMIRNLLDNAIRYTGEGGRVSLTVRADDSHAHVIVVDDGIGIPMEAQARVFERFYRVDRARSRDRGGTGLGLAIVKHVAELHGGRVEVESDLGDGSIFTATIPAMTNSRMRTLAG